MKKLIPFFLLLTIACHAQTNINVIYSFINGLGETQTVKQISFTPLTPNKYGNAIIVGDEVKRVVTGTSYTNTEISGNAYMVRYYASAYPPTPTTVFTNYFPPNLTGTVYATDYTQFGFYFGSQAPGILPGTGVTFTTNGTAITINSTGGGTNGSAPVAAGIGLSSSLNNGTNILRIDATVVTNYDFLIVSSNGFFRTLRSDHTPKGNGSNLLAAISLASSNAPATVYIYTTGLFDTSNNGLMREGVSLVFENDGCVIDTGTAIAFDAFASINKLYVKGGFFTNSAIRSFSFDSGNSSVFLEDSTFCNHGEVIDIGGIINFKNVILTGGLSVIQEGGSLGTLNIFDSTISSNLTVSGTITANISNCKLYGNMYVGDADFTGKPKFTLDSFLISGTTFDFTTSAPYDVNVVGGFSGVFNSSILNNTNLNNVFIGSASMLTGGSPALATNSATATDGQVLVKRGNNLKLETVSGGSGVTNAASYSLTNNTGFYGNAVGLTNIQASSIKGTYSGNLGNTTNVGISYGGTYNGVSLAGANSLANGATLTVNSGASLVLASGASVGGATLLATNSATATDGQALTKTGTNLAFTTISGSAPAGVITNNQTGVTLGGTFNGTVTATNLPSPTNYPAITGTVTGGNVMLSSGTTNAFGSPTFTNAPAVLTPLTNTVAAWLPVTIGGTNYFIPLSK